MADEIDWQAALDRLDRLPLAQVKRIATTFNVLLGDFKPGGAYQPFDKSELIREIKKRIPSELPERKDKLVKMFKEMIGGG